MSSHFVGGAEQRLDTGGTGYKEAEPKTTAGMMYNESNSKFLPEIFVQKYSKLHLDCELACHSKNVSQASAFFPSSGVGVMNSPA